MGSSDVKRKIRTESKRNVELWIYSFADMYMILSVFFIALSVIYAAKAKNPPPPEQSATPSAGRLPATIVSDVQLSFDKGSAELTPKAMEEIGLVLPALKQVRSGFIEVEGYADATPLGNAQFSSNLDLSTRRAVRVAEWLIKNGVPARRIRTFSYGDGFQWSSDKVPTNAAY
ncbi:MAG: OmpA family protein [Calothrix sp. SM1_5_4]|nr:OmpA family protein [Calothrix sp. SM1_5_4]